MDCTDCFLRTESRPVGRPFTHGHKNKQDNYWILFNTIHKLRRDIHIRLCTTFGGWDSSVGIATRYGLDGPGIE